MNLRSLSKTAVRQKKTDEPVDIYSVECILKKRLKKGRTEYFVKWKDWAPKYNTWEPEENFLDVEVIQEFERKNRMEINTLPKNNNSLNESKEEEEEEEEDEEEVVEEVDQQVINQQQQQQDKDRESPHEPPEFWKRKNNLVDKMLITDVFANDMTITVKEFLVLHRPN